MLVVFLDLFESVNACKKHEDRLVASVLPLVLFDSRTHHQEEHVLDVKLSQFLHLISKKVILFYFLMDLTLAKELIGTPKLRGNINRHGQVKVLNVAEFFCCLG